MTDKTVADLLNELRPLQEIREHLQHQVAPNATELAAALNKWIKAQEASKFEEREEICKFVNELLAVSGVSVIYNDKSCFLRLSKRNRYPDGVIYVTPFGSNTQIKSSRYFADLPDFTLAPAENVSMNREPGSWLARVTQSFGDHATGRQ